MVSYKYEKGFLYSFFQKPNKRKTLIWNETLGTRRIWRMLSLISNFENNENAFFNNHVALVVVAELLRWDFGHRMIQALILIKTSFIRILRILKSKPAKNNQSSNE